MINQLLLWFLALPIGLGIAVWYVLKKDVADAWIPGATVAGVGALILAISFYGARGVAVADTEIWNGQITSKERKHDSYKKPYDCNCKEYKDSKGQTQKTCDTCYEDHYTVDWYAHSTLGRFDIDSEDSTSRSVYNLPDPARYSIIRPGDACAKRSMYTNYVQAVPDSLFTPASADLKARFGGLIPAYPDRQYDIYKVDHFVSPGYSIPETAQWNLDLANLLRELGPRKQVNAIVVIAKTSDPNYEYALRDAWEGANKNDVVLLIGSAQYPKIDFVRVISWTKNELFKVELRDSVQALDTIQREKIIGLLASQINKNFERRHMSEFKYLESEIDPPTWLLILDVIVLIAGAVLAVLYTNGTIGNYRPRRYR